MEFPKFSKLPVELQMMVWERAPTARCILVNELSLDMVQGSPRVPSILHTCRLSRKIGLKRFTLIQPPDPVILWRRRKPATQPVYVDYDSDLFVFSTPYPGFNTSHQLYRRHRPCLMVTYGKIRNAVVLQRILSTSFSHTLSNLVPKMPRLERAAGLVNGGPGNQEFSDYIRNGLDTVNSAILPNWGKDWNSGIVWGSDTVDFVDPATGEGFSWSIGSSALSTDTHIQWGVEKAVQFEITDDEDADEEGTKTTP